MRIFGDRNRRKQRTFEMRCYRKMPEEKRSDSDKITKKEIGRGVGRKLNCGKASASKRQETSSK